MAALWQDIRYGFRMLIRSPGFTIVVVLVLALGIGANTAIFSFVEQVLLQSLPVKDPGSLAIVVTQGKHVGASWGAHMLSYPMFKDFRDEEGPFDGVLCWRPEIATVNVGKGAERVDVELVSADYFNVLGVSPVLGRTFFAEDETAPGANPVAVLSYDFWQNRFAGDPNVVGRTLQMNDSAVVIVGVAAPRFKGVSLDSRPGIFLPITMKKLVTPWWSAWDDRRTQWVRVLARLKPGISRKQAEIAIQPPYRQMIERETQEAGFAGVTDHEREQFLRSRMVLWPGGQGHSLLSSDLREPLSLLMILAGLVLLVTCANVSNLLIARATSRQRETTIRLAMGAGRLRIIRQALIDSLLLASAGGLAALLVASWFARASLLFVPGQLRLTISPGINGSVLAFNIIISAVAAILFGLLPVWRMFRLDLVSTLKEQATLVRSLAELYQVNPGFQTTNLIRFKLDPTQSGYDEQRRIEFCRQLKSQLQAAPGVRSVAFGRVPYLESYAWTNQIVVEGYQVKEGEILVTTCDSVSLDYCKTLRIPLRMGREFEVADELSGAAKVVMVNETFVRIFLADRNPLDCYMGFRWGTNPRPDRKIIGVVADSRSHSLRRTVTPLVLVPHTALGLADMTVYVRTSLPSRQVFKVIRKQVHEIDSSVPIYEISTMEDQLDNSLATERLVGFLSSLFGALATVLAMIGLYGVTAYSVARRIQEIGIRMALGAQSRDVLGLILREGMILAGVGIGIGLAGAWGLTRVLRSLLFDVTPTDPATFICAALLLTIVALLASYIPARRAAKIDPMEALRYE
jgi:ABC-type lipoprotein release transport system permease subunit